ncbi:hypothetical protein [Pseudomonas fluorescens]|uniref:hypothetical protein n=1 Tax=Pseudomonas fluorescens TaxID=294 RepID=UPI0017852AE7|nr:hypothetical protein [Pseudomonas fluorescens]
MEQKRQRWGVSLRNCISDQQQFRDDEGQLDSSIHKGIGRAEFNFSCREHDVSK